MIAAAAMDQRGSLKKALGTYATDAGLEEFKIHVTEVLTQHASAILLDPEWGLPAARRRAKGSGLLLAYEKTGYDKPTPGRLPDLLDLWSAKRLKEAGADCVKILLYYTPYDDAKINDHKHAWTERIGDECKANDIPFFLELVGLQGRARREGSGVRQAEARSGGQVDGGVLQGPLQRRRAEGRDSRQPAVCRRRKVVQGHQGLHQGRSAQSLPRWPPGATDKPFIYLSAGVSNPEFIEDLEFAAESGVKFNGVLCGRATWKDGIPIFAEKGGAAFRAVAGDRRRARTSRT